MKKRAGRHFASIEAPEALKTAKAKDSFLKSGLKRTGKGQHDKDKGELLISFHSVYEALRANRRTFYRVFIAKQRTGPQKTKITELAQKHGIIIEDIQSEMLDQLAGNARHQGFAARASAFPVCSGNELVQSIGKIDENDKNDANDEGSKNKTPLTPDTILVLESIEDPHNLGALIRTAICAGVNFILIPGNRAARPSPTVSAISAGAMEYAQIGIMTNTVSTLKALKDKGFWIFGLDAAGENHLFETDLQGRTALLIGGENKGIRPLVRKECDFLVSLPNHGPVNSLNASVAGGIAMYEMLRQKYRKL